MTSFTRKPAKVMVIFGTRPEAIKMAPLVKELEQAAPHLQVKVAVTAQHREMLDQVLDLFHITPDYDLDIMEPGQTLVTVTTKALEGLAGVLDRERPDLVLVHGDTTTTFVGSLAAFYHQIPVGHVEAGLRTGNKYSPYPEEINRKLTGCLSDLHFAPTTTAANNLRQEGVKEEGIFITGNTVIDALQATVEAGYQFDDPILKGLDFDAKKIILMTTHRRENLGEPMANIYRALKQVLAEHPEAEVVFPVHKNPKVRQAVKKYLAGVQRCHLIEPLDYQPFINLMARSYLVLTDSGGLQEEAPSLGKPVLVLRDTTERPEAVRAGTVRLVGTGFDQVYRHTGELLTSVQAYRQMANAVNPYGDGQASRRITGWLLYHFKKSQQPPKPWQR
jgi:UDP-N-acetylglucosamine 2-epimerase (non-hydrolysing)